MLKIIISLIISAIMAGTLGGCQNGEKPSESLKNAIEEKSDGSVIPEQVMQEYLTNYGIEINESDGDCPKCGDKNVQLTSVGLCLSCSYDMVYLNENDPEINGSDGYKLNDETETANSNNYSNNKPSFTSGNNDGEPTKEFGRFKPGTGIDSNGFPKLARGNDGYFVHCNYCGQFFFDNRFKECPDCHSTDYTTVLLEPENLASYDLYDANGNYMYANVKRLVLQGVAGKFLVVRDTFDNGKIVGCLPFDSENDSYMRQDCYKSLLEATNGVGYFSDREEIYLNMKDEPSIKQLFESIGF